MNHIWLFTFVFLFLLAAIVWPQGSNSKVVISEPEWEIYLDQFPNLREALINASNRCDKPIIITDIKNYPTPEYLVSDIMGTLYSDNSKIIIYMDKAILSNNLWLFSFVLSHEFIHFMMDIEGYPITKRTNNYLTDTFSAHIGTAIQDAVLHCEVYRRQQAYGLNIDTLPKPVAPFIEQLRKAKLLHNAEIEKEVRGLLSIDGILNKEKAFEIMSKLIQLLNLSDRLYVGFVDN